MKEHYSASQLTEPVTVIRRTYTPDGAGGQIEHESTDGPHFAFIRPLRGGERETNEQIIGSVDALFVFHRDIQLSVEDVLSYSGARYDIVTVLPPRLTAFIEVHARSGGEV